MGTKVSYETGLLQKMKTLEPGRWYVITSRKDYDKFVAAVKDFIDGREYFEFSTDYQRIKYCPMDQIALPDELPLLQDQEYEQLGYIAEFISKGFVEKINIKGTEFDMEHERPSIRFFKKDKLIAIENDRNRRKQN